MRCSSSGCGRRVERAAPARIAAEVLQERRGASVYLGFPFPVPELAWPEVVAGLVREGFTRALIDGQVHRYCFWNAWASASSSTVFRPRKTTAVFFPRFAICFFTHCA